MITVGIDIGTSYSSIAILDADGKAQPVKVKNGECIFGDSYSMPTAVFIDESGAILIGQSAVSKKMMNPSRYKGEFKRELGQDTPYHLGNLQLMPEDLYKEIFIYFKKCAEEASGDKIGKAYITYPANFSNKKKTLVEQAAKKAGIINVELIDEPTAAAYCYFSKGKINNGEKLLVYDFGGGTFDLALIEYTKGGFKPMTDALGIEKCGGVEIDRIIFDDILSSISDDILESIKQNETHRKRFYAQLMEMSIKAKHQLSSTESYSDIIMAGFESIEYNLSRTRLTSMIASLVDETLFRVKEIVKNARLEFKDIDTVLLVGGTSRIPYIKECLEKLIGKTAYRDIDPELAVCMGAALWNEMLENKEEEKEKEKEKENNRKIQNDKETIEDNNKLIEDLLIPISIGNMYEQKHGYIDKTGYMVIPPIYDDASSFSEGLAMVKSNGKWGAIDKTGVMVIPPTYNSHLYFSEGLAVVKLNSKVGVIDKTGAMVIPPIYDNVDSFSEGLAVIKLKSKLGVIDKTGVMVIPPIYNDVHRFTEGLAFVKSNNKWGVIDKTGVIVIPSIYDDAGVFSEGLAKVKLNRKCGYIDKTGNIVIPPIYDDAYYFWEGLALVKLNDKWGYIDKTGNMVIPPIYDDARFFKEGLAFVKLNDKWGCIDKTRVMVIPPIYDDVWFIIKEGLAKVKLNDKWGVIDKTGKQIVKPKSIFVTDISIIEGYIGYRIDSVYTVVNKSGDVIWKSE